MKIVFQFNIFVIGGNNSLVHELRVMAAVELLVNATYTQHCDFEISLSEKPISNRW